MSVNASSKQTTNELLKFTDESCVEYWKLKHLLLQQEKNEEIKQNDLKHKELKNEAAVMNELLAQNEKELKQQKLNLSQKYLELEEMRSKSKTVDEEKELRDLFALFDAEPVAPPGKCLFLFFLFNLKCYIFSCGCVLEDF